MGQTPSSSHYVLTTTKTASTRYKYAVQWQWVLRELTTDMPAPGSSPRICICVCIFVFICICSCLCICICICICICTVVLGRINYWHANPREFTQGEKSEAGAQTKSVWIKSNTKPIILQNKNKSNTNIFANTSEISLNQIKYRANHTSKWKIKHKTQISSASYNLWTFFNLKGCSSLQVGCPYKANECVQNSEQTMVGHHCQQNPVESQQIRRSVAPPATCGACSS